MSRNRFDLIMQNLYLADNAKLDQNDKFAKVRKLIKYMNDYCLNNFLPEQTIVIDESMIPYFGRHGAKQYIYEKPIKYGYKMWVAATCCGYCIQFMPYLGAGSGIDPALGLGGTVVDKLVSCLPDQDGSWYHIVTDNFFTSVRLLKHLEEKNVLATGTFRANRTEKAPLPDIKEMKKKPRGTYKVVLDTNNDVEMVRWKDNKAVSVASTYCDADPLGKAKRFNRADRRRIEILQPQVVKVYNFGMEGVDRVDQNLAAYMINHRSKKWWWPVFRFCVDVAVNNAFQLYKVQARSAHSSSFDLLGFRRSIVDTYYKRYNVQHEIQRMFPVARSSNDKRVPQCVCYDHFNPLDYEKEATAMCPKYLQGNHFIFL